MATLKIIPAILAKNFEEFKKQVRLFEKNFQLAQIDVMDNQLVKNKTFYDLKKIKALRTPLNYELHLMVKNPTKLIDEWKNFNKVKRVIVHIESLTAKQLGTLIEKNKKFRMEISLAINPRTKVSRLKPYKNKIKYVLLMSVQPGFGGQKLDPVIYRKIKELRQLNKKIKIGVDGGINGANAVKLFKSGANCLNVAGYLLHAKEIKEAVNQLIGL